MTFDSVPDTSGLDGILRSQDGVIERSQVLALGFDTAFIRRRLRRRDWVLIYPGVYMNHTGEPTWRQRAWSAVLDAYPAALSHGSAVAGGGLRGDEAIHIVVDRARHVTRRPGVVVHYGVRLEQTVVWKAHPPHVRFEEAVLDVAASSSSKVNAVACLADAIQGRRTTADRLLAAARGRARLRLRSFIIEVLGDIRDGTCSVLEHGYLGRVERAHGLPRPVRQAPISVGRAGFRDIDYPEWGVVIELDGRAHHDGPVARDRDMERDLDAAIGASRLTLRMGWGQVFDRPCVTARKVAVALAARGWAGTLSRCRSCPAAGF